MSLISDAGTPIISDPGQLLVKSCIDNKINVFPIPGASSVTASIVVSGFEDKFIFYGFLPKKEKELDKELNKIKDLDFSIVFFIPGVKINFYLKKFKNFFIGRKILIAREITKIHETFYRENVDTIKNFKGNLKGELTIVISKKYNKNKNLVDSSKIKIEAIKYLKRYSLKDAVELISKKEGIQKKEVYKICLNLKKNEKNY